MGDFGLNLGSSSWVSTVDSSFSNYSKLRVFSASVTAGVNTISLGVVVSYPMVAVRHPGIDVGFIRFTNDATPSVDIYCAQAGTVNFVVFTPSQTKGATGHGLRIIDIGGTEVFHSDLRYLNVNDFLPFGSSLGSGYYMLGSHRGIKYTFTEDIEHTSGYTEVWGYVTESVCKYRWEQTCGYMWDWATMTNVWSCSWGNVYSCQWETNYKLISYSAWWAVDYAINMTTKISCVRHSTGDVISNVEHTLHTKEVASTNESFSETQYTAYTEPTTAQHQAATASAKTSLSISSTISDYDQAYAVSDTTSAPNKLLTTPMDYT